MDSNYYGLYRGIVFANNDPEGRGRLRVKIPAVLGPSAVTGWCLPCVPPGWPTLIVDHAPHTTVLDHTHVHNDLATGSEHYAIASVPPEGASVWILFEQGEVNNPVWVGTWTLGLVG